MKVTELLIWHSKEFESGKDIVLCNLEGCNKQSLVDDWFK